MGNYLLAFGALVIFSVFSLIANQSIVNNKKVAMESQFIITATSLAQSVIEEAKNKAFDANATTDTITVVGSLSSTMAPEGSENSSVPLPDYILNNSFRSASFYNDIDDYNGYSRVVTTPFSGTNTITVQVAYANSTSPYDVTGTKTWCKKMTVTVTSPFISLPGGVVLTYIFTYH
jgi:hypothetical protein